MQESKTTKSINVFDKILAANDKEAQLNREMLAKHKVLCINLMSSPGAGKTTLLESTIKCGREYGSFRLGVVEGDLETNKDAQRIQNAGASAYQITTGQTCHLDALEVRRGLEHLDLDSLDIVFVENVGNLVCPASYDVGAHFNVVLLSVPEGADKVAKYPVMFRRADCVVVTKCALLEHFDFDLQEVKEEAKKLNPQVECIALDSKSKEGLEQWILFLNKKLQEAGLKSEIY
ncbi:hydrogenase nickel incorporation protein HypB [Helicobacter himalayensis]|uniref:hydrogenase nickel incorporation protein HypB n=1 Tax=Helicobacter himalayensis TaxID=1591088 RepID=UPI003D6E1C3A